MERAATRGAREASAAATEARLLAQNAAQPLPASVVQPDALARLRTEQEQIIREIEAGEASIDKVAERGLRSARFGLLHTALPHF